MPVVETPIGRLGAMLLKETRVPEAARLLVSRGAQIIVHPSGERPSDPPMHQFRQGLAYSLGVYWLTASRSRDIVADADIEDWFGAPSAIYGPNGKLEGVVDGPCEGFALATIDLDHLDHCREQQAYDTDPAPLLYRELYR
jgi:predicted amidohydrolase